ncbi:4a-hydroxytetrahydrobiopterin dehydratase [Salinactinospora qingdaonensis]|uniref:Putative pterin-4-alpha-carbinolamine dehydratase n=1 Tax=Salinactinospora qingdaonensis TaxID=702744 RepID=A0ABP7FK90_9ACTN
MATHQELVDGIAAHDMVTDAAEARRALPSIIAALARHLDAGSRDQLARHLPASLRDEVHGDGAQPLPESGGLAQEVALDLGCPPERALHLARVVLAELVSTDPDLKEMLSSALPRELAQWAADPVGAAGRTDAPTDTPTRISEDDVAAMRQRLPEWEGDTSRLSRSVELPPERLRPLLTQVDREAHALKHGPRYEDTPEGVRFTVRTESVDAVTELDLELAERIEAAITEIGSGG